MKDITPYPDDDNSEKIPKKEPRSLVKRDRELIRSHIFKLERMDMHHFARTYFENGWSIRLTAYALGVDPTAVKRFLTTNRDIRIFLRRYDEMIIGRAETKLLEHVEKGSLSAIKFVLERKGRHHGYGRQVEVVQQEIPHVTIDKSMSHEEAAEAYRQSLERKKLNK